jgi:hypothetical protein
MLKRLFQKLSPATLAALALVAAGCGTVMADNAGDVLSQIDKHSNAYKPFIQPFPNNAELRNYEGAQKLYAQPTTIIYCTTTWGNASAPLVTIPIAGKLTSSSVSYFPSTRDRAVGDGGGAEWTPERRSVDGLYHGSPPPYRYGFTPGGQYVDFFNMPTLCTTALTKFQRQATQVAVTVDSIARAADQQAQDALKRGDKAGAQRILDNLDSTKSGG